MDIQQLRSWIFELYDPLENERQYIVFDAARGNLLIDIPPYSERALLRQSRYRERGGQAARGTGLLVGALVASLADLERWSRHAAAAPTGFAEAAQAVRRAPPAALG